MTRSITGNDPLVDAIVNIYFRVSEATDNKRDELAKYLVELLLEFSRKSYDNDKIIPYKDITDAVFKADEILFSDSISNFHEYIVSIEDEETKEKILYLHRKFIGHILLAQTQREFIQKSIATIVEKAEKMANSAKETAEKAEKMANSAKETAEKAESIYESMFTNYITILGIFAAIIISIFGGLNIIKSTAISSLEWQDIVKISSLLMICEITILYFLTNMIKTLTQKHLTIEWIFIPIIIVFFLIIILALCL